MQYLGGGALQGGGSDAVMPEGQQLASYAPGPVHLFDLFIGGGFDGKDAISAQHLHHQAIQIFRTGADDDLLRIHPYAPIPDEIPGNSLTQLPAPGVWRFVQNDLPVFRKHPPHGAGQHGKRERVFRR